MRYRINNSSNGLFLEEESMFGVYLFAGIIVIGIISFIVSIFTIIPVKIENRYLLNNPIELSEISYNYNRNIAETTVFNEEAFVSKSDFDIYLKSVEERITTQRLKSGFRYVDASYTDISYGIKEVELINEPTYQFKTYGEKNLIHINYEVNVKAYSDSTQTTTKNIECNIYYIAFGLGREYDGTFFEDSNISYCCEKSYTEGYYEFENIFRSSVYLNGHVLMKFNEYDKYKLVEDFATQEFTCQYEGSIDEIANNSEIGKTDVESLMTAYVMTKCKQINYGKSKWPVLLLGPKYLEGMSLSESSLYIGSGKIKTEKGKISFDKNIYICKLVKDYSVQIAAVVDAEIKDGKLYGKTYVFSNENTDKEKVSNVVETIQNYADSNLQLSYKITYR